MKTIRFVAFLCLSLIVTGSFAEKYALIIAIGDYPEPGKNGWPKISSGNDAPLIAGALESQGFKTENISFLRDAEGTKEGIVKALENLTNKVKTGDIVVIQVSSHGEQIEDDNKDEADGLDETIVPYGAVYSYDKDKFKEYAPGYFRDDQFGQKMNALRNKLGKNGDVLVLLDACHSGTGTRGVSEAKVRGAKEPMVSRGFDTGNLGVDTGGVFKDSKGSALNADAATYALISGAQAKEPNYECYDDNDKAVGSLSYAFSKSIASLKDKTTYRGLFAEIENIMREKAPKQKPVLEGDGIDRILFGGNYVSQKPYFTIKNWTTGEDFVLMAGITAGITAGSTVSLYPAPTLDPTGKTPVAKGTVTNVTNFTSTIKLDQPNDTLYKLSQWVFVTELSYGNNKLKIDVRNVNGSAAKVHEALKDFQLVEFGKPYDIYIDTFGNANTWVLKYPNTGDTFTHIQNLEAASLKSALKSFDRFRYLQGLNFDEEDLSARVELVFMKNKHEIDEIKTASRTKNGRLELKNGDEVYLKIINTGDKKFYINIVDIQPNGKINPILPSKYINPPVLLDECEIQKYDSTVLKNFAISIGPPYGEETFKVFLSRDAIDLEDILTRGDDTKSRTRGVLSNMAKVFVESEVKEGGTRGGSGKVNTDQNGTIFSIPFTIVKN